MGAWGQGPFENDDALDWVDQVVDSPRGQWPALVRAALLAVVEGTPDGDEDEVDPAHAAVAAAAIVAAGLPDGPPLDDDGGAEAEVAADLGPVDDLVVLAREALTRVLTASSVRDVWTEVGQWDAVLTELAPVRVALGVADTP